MSPRLSQLLKMLQKEPDDPFLLYGIALEHKKAGEHEPALAYLQRTVEAEPTYAYAHFQRGQIYEELGQEEPARRAYRAGIEAAQKGGDAHAADECRGALEMLG